MPPETDQSSEWSKSLERIYILQDSVHGNCSVQWNSLRFQETTTVEEFMYTEGN